MFLREWVLSCGSTEPKRASGSCWRLWEIWEMFRIVFGTYYWPRLQSPTFPWRTVTFIIPWCDNRNMGTSPLLNWRVVIEPAERIQRKGTWAGGKRASCQSEARKQSHSWSLPLHGYVHWLESSKVAFEWSQMWLFISKNRLSALPSFHLNSKMRGFSGSVDWWCVRQITAVKVDWTGCQNPKNKSRASEMGTEGSWLVSLICLLCHITTFTLQIAVSLRYSDETESSIFQ